jgi:hypothetical protein
MGGEVSAFGETITIHRSLVGETVIRLEDSMRFRDSSAVAVGGRYSDNEDRVVQHDRGTEMAAGTSGAALGRFKGIPPDLTRGGGGGRVRRDGIAVSVEGGVC